MTEAMISPPEFVVVREDNLESLLPDFSERQRKVLEQIISGNSLYEFIRTFWPVVEPFTKFSDNWHIEAICSHLEAVTAGTIRNLIITIPPRHSKSLIVSVFWFCWVWSFMPESRWIFGSYSGGFATRDSLKCRRVIESPLYKRLFPNVSIRSDANLKARFESNALGHRLAVGTGGSVMGEGGDFLVIDDLMKASDANSPTNRKEKVKWYENGFSTRGNDPNTVCRVVMGQRLHEEDLVGVLKAAMAKPTEDTIIYEELILPMEYDPELACSTSIGFVDPRDVKGEVLWNERYTSIWCRGKEKSLGVYDYSAQYQQTPTPTSGGTFKVGSINVVDAAPFGLRWVRYYDLALTLSQTGHYTATIAVAIDLKGNIYFRRGHMEKLEAPDAEAMVKTKMKQEPDTIHGVEAKIYGAAMVQSILRDQNLMGIPITGVPVDRDKLTRATTLATRVREGKVYFVKEDPSDLVWMRMFVDQLKVFPFGKFDDGVDAMSGAYLMLVPANSAYEGSETSEPARIRRDRSENFRGIPAIVGAGKGLPTPIGHVR